MKTATGLWMLNGLSSYSRYLARCAKELTSEVAFREVILGD